MSVPVQGVLGPIASDELGATLAHEHLVLDNSLSWRGGGYELEGAAQPISDRVSVEQLHLLREDPYLSLDNVRLDDEALAIEEVSQVAAEGGRTVLDPTNRGMGGSAAGVRRISEASGVNVVLGCGYYLRRTHPPEVAGMSADDVARSILKDLREGIDDSGVRSGFIGEIGVGPEFPAEEEKVLRGAARAQVEANVPLSVHLPGWLRRGQQVLDIVETEGMRADDVILCHMNPSHDDWAYQRDLAERGAWLEFDMLGMDYLYPGEGQSPSDAQAVDAIRRLVTAGHGGQLLLSSDVFLKIMLVRYGGFGYAHTLRSVVPRMRRAGLDDAQIDTMLVENPRLLFERAAGAADRG